MSLLQEALDAYASLTRRVEHLEHDKVAQDLEITKLKTRVKKLERANKVKTLKLRRLRKVGTSQRVDTSDDTFIKDAVIRDALRLADAEGVDCLPNEEIFTGLARMGYEKPSIKLTFYKAFFSSQWKFLIHTILQSMSARRTSWNEFSSAMASAVICLSTEEEVQGNDNDAAQRADAAI
nr:hypothetical protein [Tanacetum cinerariifolium]